MTARSQWQFHLLSFEGPDAYARAGGIAERVTGLAHSLAGTGLPTHLWFIGDAGLAGHEQSGNLTLHRWCQWISRFHPSGVYDGEEGKVRDYTSSLPAYVLQNVLHPHLSLAGGQAAVLAEEWHTVGAVLQLDSLLRAAGLRDRVRIFWNANNTFGFDWIDWPRLAQAATLTTVSRYMRYRMWEHGVDANVIPNGLSEDAMRRPATEPVREFQSRHRERLVLTKIARWDPDKRWLLAIDTVAELRRLGKRPLLIARGGLEAHGREVLDRAHAAGLRVEHRSLPAPGTRGILAGLDALDDRDVVVLDTPVDRAGAQLLFGGSQAVLANSGHEPFGLVGLETMAAGGVACVGGTGEDYAIPGWNALVLQTNDPREFLRQHDRLHSDCAWEQQLRRNAVGTASSYGWPQIVSRQLLPQLRIRGVNGSVGRWEAQNEAATFVLQPCSD